MSAAAETRIPETARATAAGREGDGSAARQHGLELHEALGVAANLRSVERLTDFFDEGFAIDRAGLVGADGATHAGTFDISYLGALPGFVVMAAADGPELARMVATLRRRRYQVSSHETTAKPPRGYTADHPRIDLLRMKDIHAGKQLPPSALSTRKGLDRVADVMRDVQPLSDWLQRHVT